jgi:hypothetical protein
VIDELNRFKKRQDEVTNLTLTVNEFKDAFNNLETHIQGIVLLDSMHSQESFDKIMSEIDKLANEVNKKADKIREETLESKKQAEEIGKKVNLLVVDQTGVLNLITKKENELKNKQDLVAKAEEKLKSVEEMNKQTDGSLSQASISLSNAKTKEGSIENWKEEFVSATPSILPNELATLQERVKERQSVLKTINEVLRFLLLFFIL